MSIRGGGREVKTHKHNKFIQTHNIGGNGVEREAGEV